MPRKFKKIKARLNARQKQYDELKSDLKGAYKRPGSNKK